MYTIWGYYTQVNKSESLPHDCLNSHTSHHTYSFNHPVCFGYSHLLSLNHALFEEQLYDDTDNKIHIIADIRIDNRQELLTYFNVDQNTLDIELLCLTYRQWGTQCTDHIIGVFAFAIWDENINELFCARDRLGIKSFYYHQDKNAFYFSSRISMLRQLSQKYFSPNIMAMKKFITSDNINLDETLYTSIKILPPGNLLIFKNNSISTHKYWFPESIKIDHAISYKQAIKDFSQLLKEAIKCRLRSKYPIGFELSGGLDSSSIVCLSNQIKTLTPKSVYINRFGTYECDEGQYSQEVVKNIDMPSYEYPAHIMDYHKTYTLDFNYKYNKDWPIFATYTQKFPLAQLMHQHGIQTVLTGQGGDQVLTGNYYILSDYLRSFQWIKFFKLWHSIRYNKKAVLKQSILKPIYFHLKNILFFNSTQKNIKFNYSAYPLSQYSDLQDISNEMHSLFVNNNAYNTLEGIYGIEFRHPFYDSRLIEFTLSLPPEYKLWGDIGKKILRDAMKGIVPEPVRIREDKAEMSELLRDQISAIDLNVFWEKHYIIDLNIITSEELNNAIKAYQSNPSGRGSAWLWRLINLEYWYRINFADE